MAGGPHQREDLSSHSRILHRHLIRIRRPAAEIPHRHHLVAADKSFQRRRSQLLLSCLSRPGHSDCRAICQIHRQRQHLPRCDKSALRNFTEQKPAEAAQHILIGRGELHHHRLRRFGRSRGSDCQYRSRNRVESRQSFPPVAANSDDACGQRRGSRCGRHLQSAYRRNAFCRRGADDRPHHSVGHAASCVVNHGSHRLIHIHRL